MACSQYAWASRGPAPSLYGEKINGFHKLFATLPPAIPPARTDTHALEPEGHQRPTRKAPPPPQPEVREKRGSGEKRRRAHSFTPETKVKEKGSGGRGGGVKSPNLNRREGSGGGEKGACA